MFNGYGVKPRVIKPELISLECRKMALSFILPDFDPEGLVPWEVDLQLKRDEHPQLMKVGPRESLNGPVLIAYYFPCEYTKRCYRHFACVD